VDLLLDVWPEVLKSVPGAELWLVGEGELAESAKKIKGIKVWGKVEHKELPEIYRETQVFLSLTRDWYWGPFKTAEEYFSHTLMEAQGSGLPIIGTRCGGIPEEIGENNWLIEQKDKKGLLRAMVEVFGDKKKRQRVGRENRKRAEMIYDLKKQVGKLEAEIEKLC
jgi:phosphatidylinositol alpha-1,6-mannosyltransferase